MICLLFMMIVYAETEKDNKERRIKGSHFFRKSINIAINYKREGRKRAFYLPRVSGLPHTRFLMCTRALY